MKKYNYIYLITNQLNEKLYVGKHSTDNLDDGYMGSGYLIKKAYNKYGIENFTKQYLAFCDTAETLNYLEKFYIKKYKTRVEFGNYNLTDGGDGGNGFKGRHHTKESKLKNSESHKGKQTWIKGKHHTEESRKKMSESLKGKTTYIRTDEHRQKMSEIMKKSYQRRKEEKDDYSTNASA